MKSSLVEITTVEQLRNRIMKVAKHKYICLKLKVFRKQQCSLIKLCIAFGGDHVEHLM